MVTHDLGSLRTVCDRIAAIAGGKVIAIGTMETMLAADAPWLHDYFRGVFGPGGFEAQNTKPAHQQ
jgi:phospholipid/cholesterol/gamma-HCH transport system ATP-binding protein